MKPLPEYTCSLQKHLAEQQAIGLMYGALTGLRWSVSDDLKSRIDKILVKVDELTKKEAK